MSDRIINGDFSQGMTGWTASGCPPDPDMGDKWSISLNQRSYPDGLPTLGITLFMPGCLAQFAQAVDWTGVQYLYVKLAAYPCFWSGYPGLCQIFIGDTPVWTAQMDMPDITDVEIFTGDFNGVQTLSFRCYFDDYQTGMDVRSVSTGSPITFEPDWTIQIGDLVDIHTPSMDSD